MSRVAHDASPAAPPPIASSVPCPSATSTRAVRPSGAGELDVWRSREQVPACLAPHLPGDVDFSREMLAADLPSRVDAIEIRTPAPPVRDGKNLVIEEQAPFQPCPICRGAVDHLTPQARPARPPTRVWRIPRVIGVQVFHRLRPHPHQPVCPPCTAP